MWTSAVIIVGYAIPGFLFAILLIVLFAGGSFLDLFPLRGLTSDNWASLPWPERILDYFWHLALPLTAMALSAFATTTLLTKNSFLDEIRKQYVMTARAKGLTERQVLYGHVFRNAMLIVIAGFPGAFICAFFTGSLLIETIFSLDGLGLLGFESVLNRDYPVVFATLYIFSLMGLVGEPRSPTSPTPGSIRGSISRRARCDWTPSSSTGWRTPASRRSSRCPARSSRRRSACSRCRRSTAAGWRISSATGAATGRSGSSSSCSACRSSPNVIANDRPIVVSYKGEILFPVLVDYPESKFGGFLATTDYRDPFVAGRDQRQRLDGLAADPLLLPHGQQRDPDAGAGAAVVDADAGRALRRAIRRASTTATARSATGTGSAPTTRRRDVVARLIYGFRISVEFGLTLAIISSVIGVMAGAVQGYFGGWIDLGFQRFIEIWTSIPALYLLLIISSVIAPSFWVLLGILLLFSWVSLVGVVRAEFLRGRNFEYVNAARALGVGNLTIMFRHLLPNAMVATLTFLPFILNGSITTLTSLDFLGFGLPPGSPSLGELLAQGKDNIHAPWLGLTGFFVISLMLSLLIFVGEAVRDAFDPRKTFA